MADRNADMTRRGLLKRSAVGGVWATAAGLGAQCAAGQQDSGDARAEGPLMVEGWYYQHFDADFERDVPEKGFGGWKQTMLNLSRAHTAIVSMHAWDQGSLDSYPGVYRSHPYIVRANRVLAERFPPLIEAVRASAWPLFHVVGGRDYYRHLPGYKHAAEMAGANEPEYEQIKSDPYLEQLRSFKRHFSYPGFHNMEGYSESQKIRDFAEAARPVEGEGVAENTPQLLALCKAQGINHLIYCGFALNWCLLLSPGGMHEMSRHGVMCSVIREATTAIENKETAEDQLCKEIGLWRVALAYGFVFDQEKLIKALARTSS